MIPPTAAHFQSMRDRGLPKPGKDRISRKHLEMELTDPGTSSVFGVDSIRDGHRFAADACHGKGSRPSLPIETTRQALSDLPFE